jgi:uncharacterized membrane protein
MPPIYAAIVHFPIALAVFAVVMDWIADFTNRPPLRVGAYWALVAAAGTAALAIAAGYYDMSRASLSPEVDGYVHLHRKRCFGATLL